MRRAIHHGAATRREAPKALPATSPRTSVQGPLEIAQRATSATDAAPIEVLLTAAGTIAKAGDAPTKAAGNRSRQLAIAILQRIESRLPGRVRNLAVRIQADTVVLEGQCATYYTKQLAQHAAFGVLEDEHLENAIVVTIGR